MNDELSMEQRHELEKLAGCFSSIFSNCPDSTTLEEHHIDLTSSTTVWQHPYPVPYVMRQTLCEKVEEMENTGISPYASPVVMIKKKGGSNRICIAQKLLNKLTMFDLHPFIPPTKVLQGMKNDRYFSKIDLSKGYWQIPVHQEDIPKTEFVTMDRHDKFLRMPFGMMNLLLATLTCTEKMLVRGRGHVVDYLDDTLIHMPTWANHVRNLRKPIWTASESNLYCETNKVCAWGRNYLLSWSPTLGGNNQPSG
ncbi:Zinc finger protein [Plakobranchus ocellatus]|uniref:Zinc finger protein n=1 Tax=Plakobranchus ocellatus TaxID=259542 RepID=A0AAV3Z6J7_9GAST|nr:Zinc finger protein [Plakobranchus ocellatus]